MSQLKHDPVVIVSYARTALGAFQGGLSSLSATELGSAAIKSAVANSGLKNSDIDEVYMGNVLSAGLKQAPARQATLGAGLPKSVVATTVNKVCGSGLKTVMMAYDGLHVRPEQIIIAGGMESMSNAPYLLPTARKGMRFGHGQVLDHMTYDGLENAYDGQSMGIFAEATCDKYEFTREAQDAFALRSLSRAKNATENGDFKGEITPVTVSTRKGDVVIDKDEGPLNARPDKIPSLRPVFRKGGTVTAANSSSINDGAAALVLMRASTAAKHGLTPICEILATQSYAHEPEWFTTAPVSAIQLLLKTLNWSAQDVDLFEINEAFASVTMAAIEDLGLDDEKVNVNGGACALGHPIGASGARILVTLIHALKVRKKFTGIASLCIGGGEAVALAVRMV
ncbi:MAG: acetyl-CoA C-acyltransferase [Rhizobiales bacterium]|nr:acetyl-CoA C-acyltransferase [Hyphomicrobiales bacterium]NRB14903.1 acetyl-CoA C-acyltransferase [Hyphomicrobiales bacterium]